MGMFDQQTSEDYKRIKAEEFGHAKLGNFGRKLRCIERDKKFSKRMRYIGRTRKNIIGS